MDFYAILGCPHDATPEQIKARYRELARTHHPDKGGSPAEFHPIDEAYQVLSVAWRRTCYNDYLDTLSLEQQAVEPFIQTPPGRFDNQHRGQELMAKEEARREMAVPMVQPAESRPTHTPRGNTQFPECCSEELKAALSSSGSEGLYTGTSKKQIGRLWKCALEVELSLKERAHRSELDEACNELESKRVQAEEKVQRTHQEDLATALGDVSRLHQEDLATVTRRLGTAEQLREAAEQSRAAAEQAQTELGVQLQSEKEQLMSVVNSLFSRNGFFDTQISKEAKQELESSLHMDTPTLAITQGYNSFTLTDCISGVSNAECQLQQQMEFQSQRSTDLQRKLREHERANRLLSGQYDKQEQALRQEQLERKQLEAEHQQVNAAAQMMWDKQAVLLQQNHELEAKGRQLQNKVQQHTELFRLQKIELHQAEAALRESVQKERELDSNFKATLEALEAQNDKLQASEMHNSELEHTEEALRQSLEADHLQWTQTVEELKQAKAALREKQLQLEHKEKELANCLQARDDMLHTKNDKLQALKAHNNELTRVKAAEALKAELSETETQALKAELSEKEGCLQIGTTQAAQTQTCDHEMQDVKTQLERSESRGKQLEVLINQLRKFGSQFFAQYEQAELDITREFGLSEIVHTTECDEMMGG